MKTMKVRISGEIVDREVAHMTLAIKDGVEVTYPEPALRPGEVVYGRDAEQIVIIAVTHPN